MLTKDFLRGVQAITTRDELREAYAVLKEQDHDIRRKALIEARAEYALGDIVVCVSNKRSGDLHGELKSFSSASASMLACRTSEMLFNGHPRTWRVPPDMLRPATKEEKAAWLQFMKAKKADPIQLPPLETVELPARRTKKRR